MNQFASKNIKAQTKARPDPQQISAGPKGMAIAPPEYGINIVDHQAAQTGFEYGQEYQPLESTTWSARGEAVQRKPALPDASGGLRRKRQKNKTGLPDNLKAGIESLSGLAMDDVKVHYNSDKPVRLQALAYTQGTDIHMGPDQERHLPHEAWHVVQQKQGNVQPTTQYRGVTINDSPALEREADVMGAKAVQMKQGQTQRKPAWQTQASSSADGQHITLAEGGQVVGGVDVTVSSGQAVELTNLRVEESKRGQGGGKALIGKAAEAARAIGKPVIRLESQDKGNGKLTKWYERQGFRKKGVGKRGFERMEASSTQLKVDPAYRKSMAPGPISQGQLDSLKLAEKTGNSLSLLPRSINPIQRMEWEPTHKVTRPRSSSRSGRVQSANVEDLVKSYILMNQEKVEFNKDMSGGWERWFQGEIFFLLSQKLGAHIAVEDKVYTAGGQRADFTLETSDGDTLIVIELKCQTVIETDINFNGRVEKDAQKLGTIDKPNLNYDTIQAFQLALSPQYYPHIGDTGVGLLIKRTLV